MLGNSKNYRIEDEAGAIGVEGIKPIPNFIPAPLSEFLLLQIRCFRAITTKKEFDLVVWMDSPRLA